MLKPKAGMAVSSFNEKYIFVIGGKAPKIKDFLSEVDVYDITKDSWSQLNYLQTESCPAEGFYYSGAYQCSSREIMIIGGTTDQTRSDKSWMLDVTDGSLREGPGLKQAGYFINSCYYVDGFLYAYGNEYGNQYYVHAFDCKTKEWRIEERTV